PWATAALLAVNTGRVRIGPGVTNPVTRHPRGPAGAMLTIHELSGGRGILGLGAGDNAVRTLGRQPARIAEVREAVDICRAKFRERKADIPIYVAANGPRLAAYACEAADGIIVPCIGTPQDLRRTLDRVEVAAREPGRSLRDLPVLIYVGFAVSPARAEALARFRALARETAGLNATFFLRPDGQGKQRSFELFVREVWPALRES